MELENHFYELLTATVSHEMRTPLNSMITLLDRARTYVTNSEEGLKSFKIIESSSKMLSYLVNDLLDLFQIKNGKFKKNENTYDVAKELETVIEIMRVPCTMKGLKLIFNVSPRVPRFLILDI